MENDRGGHQPENLSTAEAYYGGLKKSEAKFAWCLTTNHFNGNFEKGNQPQFTPDEKEKRQKIAREDTNLRQQAALQSDTRSFEARTDSWNRSFIKGLLDLKTDDNKSLLVEIFGDTINQSIDFYDPKEEEHLPDEERQIHMENEKKAKELADKFRDRWFDPNGYEREGEDFIAYLEKKFFTDKTKNIQNSQDHDKLFRFLTRKLYGSETRWIGYQLQITQEADPSILKDKWENGFDNTEELTADQREILQNLQKADEIVQKERPTFSLESPNFNVQGALSIAENIRHKNERRFFLSRFILEQNQDQLFQAINALRPPSAQLEELYLAIFGIPAKQADYRKYLDAQGNLITTVENIRDQLIQTPEYQDLLVTSQSLRAIYEQVRGRGAIIPPQEFQRYLYAVTRLGVPIYEIKSYLLQQVLNEYQQQLEKLENQQNIQESDQIRTRKEELKTNIQTQKDNIKAYQEYSQDSQNNNQNQTIHDKVAVRYAVTNILKQMYDGEVAIKLIDDVTTAANNFDFTSQDKLATDIADFISHQQDQTAWQTIRSRQDIIAQQEQGFVQLFGPADLDHNLTSPPAERFKHAALTHRDLNHTIPPAEQTNLQMTRRGHLLFVYDHNLPNIPDTIDKFAEIARERAQTLGLRQRRTLRPENQIITVLIVPDRYAANSQTTLDGNVILLKYHDEDDIPTKAEAIRNGEFRHEITHAELNQREEMSPLFAVREAASSGAANDKRVHRSNEEKLAIRTPFRRNISKEEQQGYLLADFLYDFIIHNYASNPQQAAQIFHTLIYHESQRPNITLNGKPLVTYQDFVEHLYSLLGRDFKKNFSNIDQHTNHDLTDYMTRHAPIDKPKNLETRLLLEASFNQPLTVLWNNRQGNNNQLAA